MVGSALRQLHVVPSSKLQSAGEGGQCPSIIRRSSRAIVHWFDLGRDPSKCT